MTAVYLATKTLDLINHTIEADQGASFRIAEGKVLPHMADAYRGADEGFRSHLGASVVGKPCAREIWYGFHWVRKAWFESRILRLFNRGHLEEARFIAMLLSAGIQVYQQDSAGNQFRISDVGGHFGGSGDGVAIGIPDVPPGEACLLEAKTHGLKSFKKLAAGVKIAKPEHYVQMQIYMRKMKLHYALYMAVCKDNDELYFEILVLEEAHADRGIERGRTIILSRSPPPKISESPGWYECKYCNVKDICHGGSAMDINCRTCHFARAEEDGTWRCGNPTYNASNPSDILDKERQLKACPNYTVF